MNKKNWKTTAAGVCAAVSAVLGLVVAPLLDDDPATVARWAEAVPIVAAALGLGFARDFNVTSEQAGLKPDSKVDGGK